MTFPNSDWWFLCLKALLSLCLPSSRSRVGFMSFIIPRTNSGLGVHKCLPLHQLCYGTSAHPFNEPISPWQSWKKPDREQKYQYRCNFDIFLPHLQTTLGVLSNLPKFVVIMCRPPLRIVLKGKVERGQSISNNLKQLLWLNDRYL